MEDQKIQIWSNEADLWIEVVEDHKVRTYRLNNIISEKHYIFKGETEKDAKTVK